MFRRSGCRFADKNMRSLKVPSSAWSRAILPLIFILLWSSSFITARIGLAFISPLYFVTVRQVAVATILLVATLALRRSFVPLRRTWHHCAVAGVLINGVTLMTAHVGMVTVDAAPMSLMGALNPILSAVLAGPLLGERLGPRQWLGTALGLLGVILVLGLRALDSRTEAFGLLLGAAGIIGLCGGTLYFARFCRGVPWLEGQTVQFIAAAIACVAATSLIETPRATWTASALAAVAWNVGAMSIGGMGLYSYMLAHGTAGRVTASFYLVPGSVAILGWALLGEQLSPLVVLGFLVASVGVWLVRWIPASRPSGLSC
jgi:drug/metabolite transporter (DMT)-like permease